MKKCPACELELEDSSFSKNKHKKDGLQVTCRQCKKKVQNEWYKNNKFTHKENTNRIKREAILVTRAKLWEYYLNNPCVDCNETDPDVLECDHRSKSDKKACVSELVSQGYAWTVIEEELKKCDVRCANCHRKKTAKEQNWYSHLRL